MRWGFGDAVWVTVVGIVGANIVGAVVVAIRHADVIRRHETVHFDAIDTSLSTVAQYALMLGLIFLLVGRKGRGPRHDLGFVVRATDWWWASIGVAGSLVVGASLVPISRLWSDGNHGSQEIGKQLQDSASWSRFVLFLLIVCVAPVAEELLFRGIVLRAALRRMHAPGAVLVSGAVVRSTPPARPHDVPGAPGLVRAGHVLGGRRHPLRNVVAVDPDPFRIQPARRDPAPRVVASLTPVTPWGVGLLQLQWR